MTTKITVSLPDDQVAALKAAVRAGEGRSVSAIISGVVEDWKQRETLAEFLAHLDEVHGALPEEDLAWAQEALRGA